MTEPPPIIITIDGAAATGKSTIAHRLARRLGLEFLDTGAMYRAAALLAIEEGIDPDDGERLAEAIRRVGMSFDFSEDPPALFLGDRPVGDRIRDMDVSEIVSVVAAQRPVREAMVTAQRRVAGEHPRLVTEGRDQGSVVFPDATAHFFLTAAAEVRAMRRVHQLAESGKDVPLDEIVRDIEARDRLDSTRADGPLMQPTDAVVIDTAALTIPEIVDRLAAVVEQRAAEQSGSAGARP